MYDNENQNNSNNRNIRYYDSATGVQTQTVNMQDNMQNTNTNIPPAGGQGGTYATVGMSPASGKRKNRTLFNSIIILLCIVIAMIAMGMACNSMLTTGESEIRLPTRDYIAVIHIHGIITRGNVDSWGIRFGYQHYWLLNELDRIMADSNNRGLLLYIDSPGGGVYESDELYLKLVEFREKTGRPIYVSMSSMGASGAYYIATVGDRIYANRNNWTGSIGVTIGTLIDASEFLENHGIRTATIVSGENKAIGNMFDPLSQEQKNILQTLVDEAHDQFVNIIAYERNMSIADVRALADGRIYTARQALDLGLIDEIGTFADALASMKETHNLHGSELVDVRYEASSLFANIFAGINLGNIFATGDAAVILAILENQQRAPISFLCPILSNWI